jgi:predicted nucleic acid-binding Zn ribbon protein
VAAIFTKWDEIAGPELAEHVRPVRLTRGVLVVTVEHPAWATAARAAGPGLLRATGEATGEQPTRLDVVVRRR